MTAEEAAERIARIEMLNQKLGDIALDPEMWSQIIDALPSGLVVINETGRIQLVNVQTELIFGYHRSRLVGESVHMLISPETAELHKTHLLTFFSNPSVRPMNFARALAGRHSSGRSIELHISIGPLISEAGVFGMAIIRRAGDVG